MILNHFLKVATPYKLIRFIYNIKIEIISTHSELTKELVKTQEIYKIIFKVKCAFRPSLTVIFNWNQCRLAKQKKSQWNLSEVRNHNIAFKKFP